MKTNNILNSTKIFGVLVKFAQAARLLSMLETYPEDIKKYILSLDPKWQGQSINILKKNPNINVTDLKSKLQPLFDKESLKEDTNHQLSSLISPSINPNIKAWAIVQLRKYPNRHTEIFKSLDSINDYFKDESEKIASYSFDGALKEVEEYNNLPDSILNFFYSVSQEENRKLNSLRTSQDIKQYLTRKLFEARQDWLRKVLQAPNKEELMPSLMTLQKKIENGDFRGQDIPKHPLHDPKYSNIFEHINDLKDWIEAERPSLLNLPILDAIQKSKEWHHSIAQESGKYSPITPANIFYGPDQDGFFLLELKSPEDLKQEGHLMNHCVGSYDLAVEDGQSRIFSLRNQSAPYKPIITVETDRTASVIRQDYGPGNSKISPQFHDIVNKAFSGDMLEDKIKELGSEDLYELALNSSNENTLSKIIDMIPTLKNIRTRTYILVQLMHNKNITWSLALKLIDLNLLADQEVKDKTELYKHIINNTKTTEDEIFEILSLLKNDDESPSNIPSLARAIFYTITLKNNLSIKLINKLLELDKWGFVWDKLAENETLPIEIYKKIAERDRILVRERLSKNPSINDEIAKILLKRSDDVLESITQNPAISSNMLDELLANAESYDEPEQLYENISRNPSTSLETLKRLMNSSNRAVRIGVAKNVNTTSEMLDQLANDEEHSVRYGVAKNPRATTETLTRLLMNPEEKYVVKKQAEENPNAPKNAPELMLESLG